MESELSSTDLSTPSVEVLLRAGIAAARSGRREVARCLLIRALSRNPRDARAWLWLSGVVDGPDKQQECLRRVLALDPDNQAARRGMALLEGKVGEAVSTFAGPVVTGRLHRPQVEQEGDPVPLQRVSRAGALGVLAGSVLLIVTLFVIRPVLASRITGRPTWLTIVTPATATPARSKVPQPDVYSAAHAQVISGTNSTDPGSITPVATPTVLPSATPTVLPSATPSPTATPVPVVYPPTRIVIPSIGVDAPVVLARAHITDTGGIVHLVWDVPEASSAGWHEGSATLGAVGNTVINGHNWPQNAIFRNLHLVQPGEQIILYSDDIPFFYEVAEVLIIREAGQPWDVRQANAAYIQATDDERVTLFTCYPYGSIQNRLIVVARPVKAGQNSGDD